MIPLGRYMELSRYGHVALCVGVSLGGSMRLSMLSRDREFVSHYPSRSLVRRPPYITLQGIGMQQHSKSPQSMQRVLPPVASAGFTMLSKVEDAALPGPLRLTSEE
ncbi:hypothetical protein F4780DRAFT_718173 [Xylariomycetidae sp. FL0641]|nr:hypothetical protein F4780DRAFT_718173 [Xylariomycetidae sp. FL0641]